MTGNGNSGVDVDNHIFINVAGARESLRLNSLILSDAYDSDTTFKVLKFFSANPVRSINDLLDEREDGGVCFDKVFVELDINLSYHSVEFHNRIEELRYASTFSTTPSPKMSSRNYKSFKAYLANQLSFHKTQGMSPYNKTVLFITRDTTRQIINQSSLRSTINSSLTNTDLTLKTISLQHMPFSDQYSHFQATKIMITAYGTSSHNVIFMNEGSVVVMLVMKGWCDTGIRGYGAQAVASGVSFIGICAESGGEESSFRWSHRAWHLGPWRFKDEDFSVGEDLVIKALELARTWVDEFEQMDNETEWEPHLRVITSKDSESETCKRIETTTPRIHVSDFTIEIAANTVPIKLKVSLVLEIIVNDKDMQVGSTFLKSLEGDRIEACLSVYDADEESNNCYRSGLFNEFSTLNMLVEYDVDDDIDLFFFLRSTDDSKMLPGSETYFHIKPDAVYDGLNFSTVKIAFDVDYIDSDILGIIPSSVNKIVDWRSFDAGEMMTIRTKRSESEDGVMFTANLSTPFDLQRQTSQFCRDNSLNFPTCTLLNKQVTNLALKQNDLKTLKLPLIQYTPTIANPFVFLHLEKTAGSSLRRYVAKAAVENKFGVGFFLPCYDGGGVFDRIRCWYFDLENATLVNGGRREELGVIAGHFQWGVWELEDEEEKAIETTTAANKSPTHITPSCFIMNRHPIDRAISLYYERVYPVVVDRKINDLHIDDWKYILGEWRGHGFEMYRDEGMCNAMCKMLLGKQGHKGKSLDEVKVLKSNNPEMFNEVLNATKAMENLDQCLIGLQNEWEETKVLLDHWYPWFKFQDSVMMNTGRGSFAEKKEELRDDIRWELEECNMCDFEVWERSLARFDLQKEWLMRNF